MLLFLLLLLLLLSHFSLNSSILLQRINADSEICVGVLTEEDVLEPPQLLKKALTRSGLPDTGVFDVCEIGETREF